MTVDNGSATELLIARPRRLNDHLSTEDLELLVPADCYIRGFGEMEDDPGRWEAYFRGIGADPESIEEHTNTQGDKFYRLNGEIAIAHARYIHRQFADEYLKFPGVSGVDIGFAVEETRLEFENILALRIHVSQKRSSTLLNRRGLPDLTSLEYFLVSLAEKHGGDASFVLPRNWKELAEYFPVLPSKWNSPPGTEERFRKALDHLGKEPYRSRFRYPVLGVRANDLSFFEPSPTVAGGFKVPKSRLAICGLPLDVLGAEYRPNAERFDRQGVFVDPRGTTYELPDDEQLATGRARINPLVGGINIGGTTDQSGTASAIVWDRTDGKPCLLGNWHVLAGDTMAEEGQPCYQPSKFYGGSSGDVVAHLKRWRFDRHGDAALAELNGSRQHATGEILGMWRPLSGSSEPRLNLRIRKWGSASGFTEGFIDGIQMTVDVRYLGGMTKRFENQFHIAPLAVGQSVSQPGDSGSLVVMSYSPEELSVQLDTNEKRLREVFEALSTATAQDTAPRPAEQTRDAGSPSPYADYRALLANYRRASEQLEKHRNDKTTHYQLDWAEILGLPADLGPDRSDGSTAGGAALDLEPQPTYPSLIDQLESILHSPSDRDRLVDSLEKLKLGVQAALAKAEEQKEKDTLRIYLAVGMLFAGDTPGSPLGEFAIASDIRSLEEKLDFSLRPVFAPRSSFREVLIDGVDDVYTDRPGRRLGRARRPVGLGADPRGTGPHPDSEKSGTGT